LERGERFNRLIAELDIPPEEDDDRTELDSRD
jgi:hypothetical protein